MLIPCKGGRFEILSGEAKTSWCPLIGLLIEPEAVVDVAPSENAKISFLFGRCGTCNNMEGCYIHHRMENKREHPSLITINFNKPSCPSARLARK